MTTSSLHLSHLNINLIETHNNYSNMTAHTVVRISVMNCCMDLFRGAKMLIIEKDRQCNNTTPLGPPVCTSCPPRFMNIIHLLLNKHLYLHQSLRTITHIPNLTHLNHCQ